MRQTGDQEATRRRVLDATLIIALAVATLVWSEGLLVFGDPGEKATYTFGSVHGWRMHALWWCLAGVPSLVAIPLRHTWPFTAMLLAIASAGFHLLDPYFKSSPTDVTVLITMFALAGSALHRRLVMATLAATEALLFLGSFLQQLGVVANGPRAAKPAPTSLEGLGKAFHGLLHGDALGLLSNTVRGTAVPALLLAATWAVADSARTRRAHLATLQARADDLEREQEQRTALAVAAERGRITRELHDVVAHGLSVMVVQAQGGKAMLHRQPERTDAALANIVTTGRASLAEMRRLLGLARTEPGAELAPQPSLATLPDLIDGVRAGGVAVAFHVSGEPLALPAVVELAAYRIVQEALTNALKHASPGAACTVELAFGPTGLRVHVADDGQPVAAPTPGNGLRGITERVSALGGALLAGPAPTGGFEVSALLPLEADRELVA